MQFGRYTRGVQWHIVLHGDTRPPSGRVDLGVEPPAKTCNCKLQPNRQSYAATWRMQARSWVELPQWFRILPNYVGVLVRICCANWFYILSFCCRYFFRSGCAGQTIIAAGYHCTRQFFFASVCCYWPRPIHHRIVLTAGHLSYCLVAVTAPHCIAPSTDWLRIVLLKAMA